jgi:biopolymer transport protein ExbB
VLAYNWLVRRNKSITEDLAAFTNDLHGYLMSDGAVKPRVGSATPASTPRGGTPTRTAPTQEPLRTGRPTSTPAQ